MCETDYRALELMAQYCYPVTGRFGTKSFTVIHGQLNYLAFYSHVF